MNNRDAMIHKMNESGSRKQPFIFIIDFNMHEPIFLKIPVAKESDILYDLNGFSNSSPKSYTPLPAFTFKKFPIPYSEYLNAFEIVQKNLMYGNSYLVNLTIPTRIETELTLQDIFEHSKAKYKLRYKDKFVVFSPEIFVQINEEGIISSCPMKGTIDASIEHAEQVILNDKKEFAEHCTIVDLIRNDLSMVAKNVYVDKFRYIDRIKTHEKELLQVSSCICGKLGKDFHHHLGDIIFGLLPAGSISGAPKKKTVDIIHQAENYDRGYYTGICGYYDGEKLDSGVMIRFIENRNGDLVYKSGGGITIYSNPESEYQELIDKVYVPVV